MSLEQRTPEEVLARRRILSGVPVTSVPPETLPPPPGGMTLPVSVVNGQPMVNAVVCAIPDDVVNSLADIFADRVLAKLDARNASMVPG